MKVLLFIICVVTCIFFLITISSCSGSIPEPTPAHAEWAATRWTDINISRLQEGRKTYIKKCSGCHGLKNPTIYSETEWDTLMISMGKKAKLNKGEFEIISRYVITLSFNLNRMYNTKK